MGPPIRIKTERVRFSKLFCLEFRLFFFNCRYIYRHFDHTQLLLPAHIPLPCSPIPTHFSTTSPSTFISSSFYFCMQACMLYVCSYFTLHQGYNNCVTSKRQLTALLPPLWLSIFLFPFLECSLGFGQSVIDTQCRTEASRLLILSALTNVESVSAVTHFENEPLCPKPRTALAHRS